MTREEEAIKCLKSLVEIRKKYCDMQTMKDEMQCLEIAIKALEQEPTDDATLKDIFCMGCEYKEQEPKTGHWIDVDGIWFKCSECDAHRKMTPAYKEYYCPNCGCRMVEPQESEET